MEHQTPMVPPWPQIKDEASQKLKRAILILGGGEGKRGTNFPSILSKIVAREEGGKQVKQWQARALAIKHYLLDKCIIHPMDNAISFLNSYLSGGTTDQRGKTSLSVVGGLDKAVSPAVHLHSVASQLICLLKLCIHSF